MESSVIVLDFLPNGRQTERGFLREPLALGVGETELELGSTAQAVAAPVAARAKAAFAGEKFLIRFANSTILTVGAVAVSLLLAWVFLYGVYPRLASAAGMRISFSVRWTSTP